MNARKAALVAAVALVAALTAVPGALAHAVLVSTTPLRGTTVETAPKQVVFAFSEPVETTFSSVHIYDSSGNAVDDGKVIHPENRSSQVAVGVDSDVPDGTYTATFRVI